MSLSLYTDHHIRRSVVRALRRRGVTVRTTQEEGTGRINDELLLARATELEHVLITHDTDFLSITARWLRADRHFFGVAFARQGRLADGEMIDELEILAKVGDAADVRGRVLHLPI